MGTARKQYGPADEYEVKLRRVGDRLGVKDLDWNWDRWGCWVVFTYKGERYRFEHTISRAEARGIKLRYGSDAFAQVVLALEDLARITERGIYDLGTWVAGLKFLPAPTDLPDWVKRLGFAQLPGDVDAVKTRYRCLAKQCHPDVGGNASEFAQLHGAYQQALQHFGEDVN